MTNTDNARCPRMCVKPVVATVAAALIHKSPGSSAMLLVRWSSAVVLLEIIGFSNGAATTQKTATVQPHTRIKWLINTGNFAGRWPPPHLCPKRNNGNVSDYGDGCRSSASTLNTITRLQMIRGGTTAVFVMPTGDGGNRCCDGRAPAQFSLGFVKLQHGTNNLYPAINPFPDWRAFVDSDRKQEQAREKRLESPATDPSGCPAPRTPRDSADVDRSDTATTDDCSQPSPTDSGYTRSDSGDGADLRRQRIINAVDAFLDDRGRLLWVLDTGEAGEKACSGTIPAGNDQPTVDVNEMPKFLAIDVYTNQTVSIVSLSRMWRPGVSCFQYLVAIYPDNGDESHGGHRGKEGMSSSTTSPACMEWPLVVVGDAGTNRLLVYSHGKDRFTEIMLPVEEEHFIIEDTENEQNYVDGSGSEGNDGNDDGDKSADAQQQLQRRRRRKWPTRSNRDILYMVPLTPMTDHMRVMVTYYGCQEVYKIRLHLATSELPTTTTDPSVPQHAPPPTVTGTLTSLGRKPCRMIILGTDRRRIDGGDDGFPGGGTTVFFRLENTNDIWSWDTRDKRKSPSGTSHYIDERDFRLVRLGKTCRVPVAVAVAPAIVATRGGSKDDSEDGGTGKKQAFATGGQRVQQLVWMLETNFNDHFSDTTDQMGVNAKLQPIEIPLYDSVDDPSSPISGIRNSAIRPPPLRVQPARDRRRNPFWSSTRSLPHKTHRQKTQ